jgi:hypothetical protein
LNRTQLKSVAVALCLLSAGVAGCEKSDAATASGASVPPASSTPPTSSAAVAESEPPGAALPVIKPGELKAGPAYLAVAGTGIVMMDGGTTRTIQPLRYGVKRMLYGVDGAVWVIAIDGNFRIVGTKSRNLGEQDIDALTVVSDKEAWAVSFTGIHHWSGGVWSVEDKAVLGNVTLLRDVALDVDGNLWVASVNQLHRRKKGERSWKTVDLGKQLNREPFFNELGHGPDGTLYASWSGGVLMLRGGEWTKVAANFGDSSPNQIDVSPAGTLGAVAGLGELFVIPPAGHFKKIIPKSANIAATAWKDVAVDGSGRLWLATDNGLAVLDQDGKRIEYWQPGTLAGVSGAVKQLVVVGNGPERLPAAGAAATGTVVGKIIKDGSPVANADIQICASPNISFEITPCAGEPFLRSVKADMKGQFTFPGVPISSYEFAIKRGDGKWIITLGGGCCTAMKHGQEFDVGSLQLR